MSNLSSNTGDNSKNEETADVISLLAVGERNMQGGNVPYKKSGLDVGLKFSLWNPQSSVSDLSSEQGENEVVSSVLVVIQDFLCLETDWILAASVDDITNDVCKHLRNVPVHRHHRERRHNRLRGRALALEGYELNDDTSVVLLQTPQVMIQDAKKETVEWTTWTLQYSVLEPFANDWVIDPTSQSDLDYYSRLTDQTQAKLNKKINNGKIDEQLQHLLPVALTSTLGIEYETFTGEIINGEEYRNTVGASDGLQELKFEPESHSLKILGVLMLFVTVVGALLLFRVSRQRRMKAERKQLEEADGGFSSGESVNSMFDDEPRENQPATGEVQADDALAVLGGAEEAHFFGDNDANK